MQFSISRQQQKIFIENFMEQTLTLALDLTERGQDKGSPGKTIHAIGLAIIDKLRAADFSETPPEGELQ